MKRGAWGPWVFGAFLAACGPDPGPEGPTAAPGSPAGARVSVHRAPPAPWRPAGDLPPAALVTAARRALRSPHPETRREALAALALAGPAADGALADAVALGGEHAVQALAASAGQGDRSATRDRLLRALRGRSPAFHDPACAALAHQVGPRADGAAVRAALAGLRSGRLDPTRSPSCLAVAAPGMTEADLPTVSSVDAGREPLVRGLPAAPLRRLLELWSAEGPLPDRVLAMVARFRPALLPDRIPRTAWSGVLDGLLADPGAAPDAFLDRVAASRDHRCGGARLRDLRRGWPGDLARCGWERPAWMAVLDAEAIVAGLGAEEARRGWLGRARRRVGELPWALRSLDALTSGDGAVSSSDTGEAAVRGQGWRIETTGGTLRVLLDAPGASPAIYDHLPRTDALIGARLAWEGPDRLLLAPLSRKPTSAWGGYHPTGAPGTVYWNPGSGAWLFAFAPIPPRHTLGWYAVGRWVGAGIPGFADLPTGTRVTGVSRETPPPDHQSTSARNPGP